VSQFFIKKAIEDALIACPTACLSGASRQEMGQIVSFFRAAEVLAACRAGNTFTHWTPDPHCACGFKSDKLLA
jgi:hypothetical protein